MAVASNVIKLLGFSLPDQVEGKFCGNDMESCIDLRLMPIDLVWAPFVFRFLSNLDISYDFASLHIDPL